MIFDKDFIKTLLDKIDIIEIISEKLSLTRKGEVFVACCPFHNERTPSFTISQTKQFFYCFGCKEHGNAINFLMKINNLSFSQVIQELSIKIGISIPNNIKQKTIYEFKENQEFLKKSYTAIEKLTNIYEKQFFSSEGTYARNYLISRGFTEKTLRDYNIGFSTGKTLEKKLTVNELEILVATKNLISAKHNGKIIERFYRRIIFPVRDERGIIVALGGRALSAELKSKYINSAESEIFQKRKILYGLYETKTRLAKYKYKTNNYILLVEGYLDVLASYQMGIQSVVATLGTSISDYQILNLLRIFDRIYICYDSDEAGYRATESLIDKVIPYIKTGKFIFFVDLKDGNDPASLLEKGMIKDFRKAILEAKPLSCKIFEKFDMKSMNYAEDRSIFLEKTNARIEKIPDKFLKEELRIIQAGYFGNNSNNKNINSTKISIDTNINRTSILKDRFINNNRPVMLVYSLLLQNPKLIRNIKLDQIVLKWLPDRITLMIAKLLDQTDEFLMASTLYQRITLLASEDDYEVISQLSVWENLIDEKNQNVVLTESIYMIAEKKCSLSLNYLVTLSKQRKLSDKEQEKYLINLSELSKIRKLRNTNY